MRSGPAGADRPVTVSVGIGAVVRMRAVPCDASSCMRHHGSVVLHGVDRRREGATLVTDWRRGSTKHVPGPHALASAAEGARTSPAREP